MKTKPADLLTTCYGSIITVDALSARGRRWLRANVDVPISTIHIDCDHRMGIDILEGALADGLRLQDAETGRIAVR